MTGVNIRNNIMLQTGAGNIITANNAIANTAILYQGNNYYSTGTFKISWAGTIYNTLAAWRTAQSQESVSSSPSGYSLDPVLVAGTTSPGVTDPLNPSGAGNFKLQNTSPMARTGLDLASLFSINVGSIDYFGTPILKPYAIGAHLGAVTTGWTLGVVPMGEL
jgi:hypothetical protein